MHPDPSQLKDILPILLPLLILNLILLIISVKDLVAREASRIRGNKVVWGFVCVLISTVGPILYLIAGRKD